MPEGVTSRFLLTVFGAVSVLLLPPRSIFQEEFQQEFVGGERQLIQTLRGDRLFNLIGTFIGVLLIAPVANKIGRKGGILLSNFCLQLGLILTILSVPLGSPFSLIGGRFLRGLSSGLNSGLIPMYLMEIAPERIRGAVGTSYYLTLYLSGVITLLSPLVIVWPMNYLCPFVPGFLQVIILFLSPESPKFSVIIKKNQIRGERALVSLRGTSNVQHELDQMKAEGGVEAKLCDLVTDSSLRGPLLISCIAMLAQVFCGFNVVGCVSTEIFSQVDLDLPVFTVLAFGMLFFEFVVILTSLLIVDKVGRRPLLLAGLFGIFVALISITSCALLMELVHWFSYLGIIIVIIFKLLFCLGPGPIPWYLASELFTTVSRPWVTSAVALLHLIGNLAEQYLTLQPMTTVGQYIPLVFALLLVPCSLYLCRRMPETKWKSLKEISPTGN